MPLLLVELPAMLEQDVSLQVESDVPLCTKVEASKSYRQKPKKGKAPKPKKPVPVEPGVSVQLKPIEILKTLGLAMLPPRHVRQHLASWHWALVRYGYLIEPASKANSPLRTNELMGDYRYHHMTALSEAFGVACALSCAQGWLASGVPSSGFVHLPIDFDYLIGPGSTPLPGRTAPVKARMTANAKRRPDYLIVAEDGSRGVTLLIVECKGTSKGPATAIEQLGSAMHQLEGVAFMPSPKPNVSIARHAYAALVSKRGAAVRLYGVDPPEHDGQAWVRPVLPSRQSMQSLSDMDIAGRLLLPSPAELAGRALRRVEDRVVAWAGAGDDAQDSDIQSLDREESRFGDVVGATSSLTLPDGDAVEVFTGALLDAVKAATDSDDQRALAERTRIGHAVKDADDRRLGADENREQAASHIDEDGLVLRIKVTKGRPGRSELPS
jgi:hypothetical protein